jgi:SAM-dependent methyltransferase
MVTATDRLICPTCSTGVDLAEVINCGNCGAVGAWVPGERRIDWQVRDETLVGRVDGERGEWDAWADGRGMGDIQPPSREWLANTRTMRAAAAAAPAFTHPAGKRMLDIGGACRHSARFLRDGVSHVDQVEVSPQSQRLALRRLEYQGIDAERVVFHTTPAERLPFEDETFDLVFASGTIHHTLRRYSLPEVHRVLKPGGQFLFIESYLPQHLHPVMRMVRCIRNADVGTDYPFGDADLEILNRLFEDVQLYPFDVLWLPWGQTIGRTAWGKGKRAAVARLDERLGNAFGLAKLIGTQCWVAGRKDR